MENAWVLGAVHHDFGKQFQVSRLAKLDARDRVQLVITAYETGLVSVPR